MPSATDGSRFCAPIEWLAFKHDGRALEKIWLIACEELEDLKRNIAQYDAKPAK